MNARCDSSVADAVISVRRFSDNLRHMASHEGAEALQLSAKRLVQALARAGAELSIQPPHSGDWSAFLVGLGYARVACDSFRGYAPSPGDVALLESPRSNSAGHLQAFDGRSWVSSAVQDGFWPTAAYRRAEPGFEIFRPPRPCMEP